MDEKENKNRPSNDDKYEEILLEETWCEHCGGVIYECWKFCGLIED